MISKKIITGLCHPSLIFSRDYWTIGLILQFSEPRNHKMISDTLQHNPISWLYPQNPENIIADPFISNHFGEPMLFCERVNAAKRKGNISCIKISDLQNDPEHFENYFQVALELDTHLSYPCLFEYDNTLYMIPENCKSNTITIYKCIGEPDSWVKEKTIFEDFAGVDNTIFFHNGYWWLFATRHADGTRLEDQDLYIWYAKNPLDEWHAHPQSPVHYEDASARGAGLPFEIDGVLYRPTQDCRNSYGGKLNIKQILRLDTEGYNEEIVENIAGVKPCQYALHTFSFGSGVAFVDGRYRKIGIKHLLYLLKYR